MIAYHCDSNAIIAAPFKSRAKKQRLLDYGAIIQQLKDRSILVDLQILDNKARNEYKRIIKYECGAEYQSVPPNIHRRNTAECTIRTFKTHFLSTLSGIAPNPPNNLWDLLLPQTELSLNILRKSNLNPNISAWEYF